ncbi:putative efflux protein, MATE family [Clostridium collagenovorans DSM 3089]|uniref:Probable multidrug resistance protein NorM n=1 Tax=Clostridium collagenovorans DSM 3089 TaxID=1121306 RepID=A0A1M5T9R1_9CLOT|nr:MATE family efflux transporter [Clostridium collagenovorans]SHH47454.1 putative efflux protein, MATE family [Clostridium collagenovorans DSM 3089]
MNRGGTDLKKQKKTTEGMTTENIKEGNAHEETVVEMSLENQRECENEYSYDKKGLAKYTFKLALPAIMEMVMQTLLGFADMAMVGRLGAIAISAVGLSQTPTDTALGIFAAISVGATALVARAIGAKKREEAGEVAKQALIVSVGLAVFFTVFALMLATPIIKLMGAEADVIADGVSYFKITNMALPFMIVTIIMSGVLRGIGDTKTPMYINGAANILNIIGNFLLIFPSRTISLNIPFISDDISLFIPGAGLGVSGAAISTSISRVIAGFTILYFILNSKSQLKVNLKKKLRLNLDIIRRMFKVGIPAAIEQFLMRFGMLLFARIIADLGTVTYAAHRVASTAESLSYNAGFGFALAATSLVGQYLGAKDEKMAERSGFMAVGMGTIFMSIMGLILFFFPELILRVFTDDPVVIEQATVCLKIVAISQPFLAASMGFSGALRGSGDTTFVLVAAVLGIWGVRLTLTYLFVSVLGWGLFGAWLVMGIDVGFRAILLFIRFKSGKWKKIQV